MIAAPGTRLLTETALVGFGVAAVEYAVLERDFFVGDVPRRGGVTYCCGGAAVEHKSGP